jgi:hypothetical protein
MLMPVGHEVLSASRVLCVTSTVSIDFSQAYSKDNSQPPDWLINFGNLAASRQVVLTFQAGKLAAYWARVSFELADPTLESARP